MSGYVLVVNAGSSSLKYSLVDGRTGEARATGLVERIGEPSGVVSHTGPEGEKHRDEREVARGHPVVGYLGYDHVAVLEPTVGLPDVGPDLPESRFVVASTLVRFDPVYVGAKVAGNMIGAWLGTHSTITKGEGFIRFVLNAVLIVFIIKLMFF